MYVFFTVAEKHTRPALGIRNITEAKRSDAELPHTAIGDGARRSRRAF